MRREKLIAGLTKKHSTDVVSQINDVKFYEYEGKHGVAFTACLIFGENGSFLSRGVSICSVAESFNRKDGRNRAIGRAIRALARMENSDAILPYIRNDLEEFVRMVKVKENESVKKVPIRIPRYFNVYITGEQMKWKSAWLPELTEYEKKLFG